jgi:phage gp29-like protein
MSEQELNRDPGAPLPPPDQNREIASIGQGRDITRGYLGPLLVPQDLLLTSRGGDLRLYEQVLSEPQVQSTLQQRRNAVIKCEWDVRPGGTAQIDQDAADFLKEQLKKVNWDRITAGMHYGVFYGYAVAEMIYGQEGDKITIENVKVRNRRRFKFDGDQQLRLQTFADMVPGEPALPPYFWNFRTGADHDDEPYGLGLAHWLYWPALFKRNGIKFWLVFLEKFGMPTAIGKYDQSASDVERTKLLAAAAAIQTDAGMIMPKEMELSLLEAARSGTADYKSMHDTMEETIAKVVLGQTLTSQVGASGGNRALGNVHMEVRQDLVKADADLICESFNLGPARWITEWNFPGAAIPQVYREVDEPEDKKSDADRDKVIADMGFKPTLDYITQKYGGEWVEVKSKPAVPPRLGGDASFAEGDPQDPPARQTDLAAKAIAPSTDDWIDQIKALVDKASTLEEVRDGLIALGPDMSLDDYTDAMRQALAAAALAGRYEILREAGGA